MKNINKLFGIIALIAVTIFSMVACDDGTGTGNGIGNGDGNYQWLITKTTTYTITGGVAGAVASETEQNWITHRSTSDTNFEYKYTSGSQTIHYYRSGQNYTYITDTLTTNVVYHSASGLTQSQTTITALGTTERSYTIELLNDADNVRTWKQTLNSNGTYTEIKIQNGRTLEYKSFTATGVLIFTLRYTYTGNTTETRYYNESDVLQYTSSSTITDNATIRAKLPSFSLGNVNYPASPASTYSETAEVVSDSTSSIIIRVKRYNAENLLTVQTDTRYERFSR